MAKKKTNKQIIDEALDGRTYKWLAKKIKMHTSNLSKKINGKDGYVFTEKDKYKLNTSVGIVLP